MTCLNDSMCDDMIDCTLDTCGVGGFCRHTPEDSLCPMGMSCDPANGCGAGMACTMDEECDDSVDCTLDTCGVLGRCSHMPIDARCLPGTCDITMGCIGPTGCMSDAECNDETACTMDTCLAGGTCENAPNDSLCTGKGERCATIRGCYVPMPCTDASMCQDTSFCNGAEICMPEFGCAPALAPRSCDDSDECTIDMCDMGTDMCLRACNTAMPACDCPVAAPTCAGTFQLSPTAAQSCAVSYNVSRVAFENLGGGLVEITPFTGHFGTMSSDVSAGATCPDFNAVAVVAGGCEETYRLQGTFSDDNTFTGMWTARFVDFDGFSCLLGGCADQSIPVTGTRM